MHAQEKHLVDATHTASEDWARDADASARPYTGQQIACQKTLVQLAHVDVVEGRIC